MQHLLMYTMAHTFKRTISSSLKWFDLSSATSVDQMAVSSFSYLPQNITYIVFSCALMSVHNECTNY